MADVGGGLAVDCRLPLGRGRHVAGTLAGAVHQHQRLVRHVAAGDLR